MLTMGRLAAAPLMVLCFALFDRPLAEQVALGIFVVAAVTDFFDGWLARWLNQISAVGSMLDPIADKVMVAVGLAIVAALHGLDIVVALPLAFILTREVLVSGVREYLGDVKLPVTTLAKWKTTVQMVAIALLLLSAPPVTAFHMQGLVDILPPGTERVTVTGESLGGTALRSIALILLWIAAGLTLVTGWDYVSKAIGYIRRREGR